MKVTGHYKKTDQYELTVTATMRLEQWKQVLEQLSKEHFSNPAAILGRAIRNVVDRSAKQVEAVPDVENAESSV